jgi:hypothetical protein
LQEGCCVSIKKRPYMLSELERDWYCGQKRLNITKDLTLLIHLSFWPVEYL